MGLHRLLKSRNDSTYYVGTCNNCGEKVEFIVSYYDIEQLGNLENVVSKYAFCEEHRKEPV